ncbi:DUF2062 domain-containing protein [Synechococcus sp. M16CYN]|uniref:DUF2062 domain-containing protein n=1 Tax=Synechococcus sp. M16CYN TaxID=3103139 RepID=UPI00325109E8
MHRLLSVSRQYLRRNLQLLREQEGTPGRRARGIAAGVLCGCLPFFGLQVVLSMSVAGLIRGNYLLAAAGTLISNPFTYVPLYWLNYQVGCSLLGPSSLSTPSRITHTDIWVQGWDFSQRILLGSGLVGLVCSAIGGVLAYKLFRRHEMHQSRRRGAVSNPSVTKVSC